MSRTPTPRSWRRPRRSAEWRRGDIPDPRLKRYTPSSAELVAVDGRSEPPFLGPSAPRCGGAPPRGLVDWVATLCGVPARIVAAVGNVTTIARGGREVRVLIQRRLASQLRGRPTPARPALRWCATPLTNVGPPCRSGPLGAGPGIEVARSLMHIPRPSTSLTLPAEAVIFNAAGGVQVAVVENGVVRLMRIAIARDLGHQIEARGA